MSKSQTVLNKNTDESIENEFFGVNDRSTEDDSPITNKLSSSPDNSASTLNLTNGNSSTDNLDLVNKSNQTTMTMDPNFEDTPNPSASIVIERPSDHDQLVKPAIDTQFLMTNQASIPPEGDVVSSDPIDLLLNETASVSSPPKPVPAFSTVEKSHPHTSNPKKAHTLDSSINISTTKDNIVSSHYLNKNEKFIGIFNYIELPPSTKHKSKRKSTTVEKANKNEDSSSKKPTERTNSVTFDLGEEEHQQRDAMVMDEEDVMPIHLTSEEISKQIDKEYEKIQAQMKNDLAEEDAAHPDDLESEISILSPYSPNNINILEQKDASLETAIPIQSAVVTECSQSPFSTSEDKNKVSRSRARSRAHSLNHLRNRSFSGKLGLGSFGLGLANLTNLTENGELAITEDNAYLYNVENDASLDGLSTISSNLSINLK